MHLERAVQRVFIMWCLMASACATAESPLQQLAKEGQHIRHTLEPAAGPEEKVRTAHELLVHAQKYEQLIYRSPSPDYTARVERVRRDEKEMAAHLLRTAAEEFAKQKAVGRARAVYAIIIDRFDQEYERPIRRSAQSALNQLQIK